MDEFVIVDGGARLISMRIVAKRAPDCNAGMRGGEDWGADQGARQHRCRPPRGQEPVFRVQSRLSRDSVSRRGFRFVGMRIHPEFVEGPALSLSKGFSVVGRLRLPPCSPQTLEPSPGRYSARVRGGRGRRRHREVQVRCRGAEAAPPPTAERVAAAEADQAARRPASRREAPAEASRRGLGDEHAGRRSRQAAHGRRRASEGAKGAPAAEGTPSAPSTEYVIPHFIPCVGVAIVPDLHSVICVVF